MIGNGEWEQLNANSHCSTLHSGGKHLTLTRFFRSQEISSMSPPSPAILLIHTHHIYVTLVGLALQSDHNWTFSYLRTSHTLTASSPLTQHSHYLQPPLNSSGLGVLHSIIDSHCSDCTLLTSVGMAIAVVSLVLV